MRNDQFDGDACAAHQDRLINRAALLPPKLWAKAFRAAYDQVPAVAKTAAPAKPGAKPQPLRGNKVPSGNSSKQPKNLFDAIGPAFE